MEELYTYWFFLLKSEYANDIPVTKYIGVSASLFAYTDSKKLSKEFFAIHKRDAFIKIKKKVTKSEVRYLAAKYQNYIIRMFNIDTKDHHFRPCKISIALTEQEYMYAENHCYAKLDDVWKYVWDSNELLRTKYKKALDLFGYSDMNRRLTNGECVIFSDYIEADVYGALISLYKPILEGRR